MNRNLLFGLLILIIFLYQCQRSEPLSAVNRRWVNQGGLQDSLHGVPYDVQADPSQVNQVKLQQLRYKKHTIIKVNIWLAFKPLINLGG